MTPLPAGWSIQTVKDLLPIRYGKSLAANLRVADGKYPVVGSAGEMARTDESLINGPTIIVGRKGNVGAVQLLTEGGWPIDTTYYSEVPVELDPRFVAHQLIALRLVRLDSSTATPSLRRQDFEAQELVVPPLDEQRRIVDILEDHLSRLDAVDASFVSVRAKVIALRDAISASALFADLAGEAGHRSRVSVGDVADVDSGPAFKSSLFGGPGAGTRLLRGDNIEPGSLRWGRTKSWPDSQLGGFEHLLVAERDIILAMDRPVVSAGLKLARVTESDIPALLVQRVARIRPRDTVVGDFLYQILSSRQFVHQLLGNQVGTQIPHITLEAIRKFAFLLPEPAVQIAVARQVRAHFESTERVEHDITLASTRSRSLRRSLLAAAFSGRLTGRSNDMEMVEEMAGV